MDYGLVMMRGRIVCIYTVSPQERGRELRRRPECMHIVSNHRDPFHACETTRPLTTERTLNLQVTENIQIVSVFMWDNFT